MDFGGCSDYYCNWGKLCYNPILINNFVRHENSKILYKKINMENNNNKNRPVLLEEPFN